MSAALSQSKSNIFETVTQKIAALIEAGAGTYKAPWHMPGSGCTLLPTNAATHAEYRGVNILSLWIDAQLRGYASAMWASYQQWQKLGAQVRKGERGSLIVFYKRAEAGDEESNEERKARFIARASHVFNASQVDGYEPVVLPETPLFRRIQEVEAFVKAVNVSVHHGFSAARYRLDVDAIEMPDREWFIGTWEHSAEESYYSVLLHELTHWVGAPHRLNRTFGKRFGDQAYAFEELVAELGAAFMCAAFGLTTEPRPDHAAYVASWLKVLGRDPKAIFTAASKAQEAFEQLTHLATRNGSDQKI